MSGSFEALFFQSIDYWLSDIQKINGCIQCACNSASKMDVYSFVWMILNKKYVRQLTHSS